MGRSPTVIIIGGAWSGCCNAARGAGGRSPRVRGRFAAGRVLLPSHVRHGYRVRAPRVRGTRERGLLATRAGVLTPLQERLFGPPAAPRPARVDPPAAETRGAAPPPAAAVARRRAGGAVADPPRPRTAAARPRRTRFPAPRPANFAGRGGGGVHTIIMSIIVTLPPPPANAGRAAR